MLQGRSKNAGIQGNAETKIQCCVTVYCSLHDCYSATLLLLPANIARKLLLLPILCTLAALTSSGLDASVLGIGGLFNGGLVAMLSLVPGRESGICNFSAFDDLRLRPRRTVPDLCAPFPPSSPDSLLRFSMSPKTVLPFVAKYSSAIPTKRMTPLSGVTPSESAMNVCIMTAFRLLVVGWI